MVIFTYGSVFSGRDSLRIGYFAAVRAHGGAALGSPPLCFGKVFWFAQDILAFGIGDPVKHLVHGFLNAGVRPVKSARGLGSKLTKHVPVPQSLQGIKYTIRAHFKSFSSRNVFGHASPSFAHSGGW
jgi:hypothetical protein